jgi:hypothetical protein
MRVNETAVEKMILVAETESPFEECDCRLPIDKNWQLVGDDIYWNGKYQFAGPSGGNPERTLVNIVTGNFVCPVCNGIIDPFSFDSNGNCGCSVDEVKDMYGLL